MEQKEKYANKCLLIKQGKCRNADLWLEEQKKFNLATQQHEKVVEQNRNLQVDLAAHREALLEVAKNEDCCCSSDDTCRPQRIASRALARENKEHYQAAKLVALMTKRIAKMLVKSEEEVLKEFQNLLEVEEC